MSNPFVLTVIPKGSPEHPRFVVANDLHMIWTGEAWSLDEGDGLLFADEAEVASAVRELLLGAYDGTPVVRFVAPLVIELRSHVSVDIEAVRSWLMRAARLYTNSDFGNGPDDSLALLSINWFDLKRAEE